MSTAASTAMGSIFMRGDVFFMVLSSVSYVAPRAGRYASAASSSRSSTGRIGAMVEMACL